MGGRIVSVSVERVVGRARGTDAWRASTASSSIPSATIRSSPGTARSASSSSRTSTASTPCSRRGGAAVSRPGIASALRALSPDTKVYACEPENGAPLTAAFANGGDAGQGRLHAFLRGRRGRGRAAAGHVGARERLARGRLLDLARANGCGREAPARAGTDRRGRGRGASGGGSAGRARGAGRVVCIISGGNIDAKRLAVDPRRPRAGLVDESLGRARRRVSRSSARAHWSRA